MKTEVILEQINQDCEKYLLGLDFTQLETAKALCRAAYKMGLVHGTKNSTLEIIGADELIETLNKTKQRKTLLYKPRKPLIT